MDVKTCLECDSPFQGRIDKKFCSDQCRFLFNNRKKRNTEVIIANVNQILRRNRTLLKGYNPVGKTTIRRQLLEAQGFNFDFYTHTFRTKAGMIYYFCYEYGYTMVEDEKVVLITWQSYMHSKINSAMFKRRFDK